MATVIDVNAFKKNTAYIEIDKGKGRLVASGTIDDSVDSFINLTVFIIDVDPSAPL